jgi:malate dehydrogenase
VAATVCIVGAGELGGAVADALARAGNVASVLMIDAAGSAAGSVAAGKALDIQQSGAIIGIRTRVDGTGDLTRIAGCAVIVLADRHGAPSSEWQGDEGRALVTTILPDAGDAPIVFAGASHTALIESLVREAGVPSRRLIGSASEALASALTSMVAMEAGCSPSEIRLTVLGSPPRGLVVPWSEASIGGFSLERVLTQVQLRRLEARADKLWPPGAFTLGIAAARVAEAIVSSSRRTFSVISVLDSSSGLSGFGARGRAGALPCRLSTSGIVDTRVPTLSARERVQLETALTS